jgi:hypothetical protein
MEETLKQALSEAIHQVPSLVVLAVVVYMFVKVIFRFIKHIEDRGRVMENLHREHMDERQSAREMVDRITVAIGALTSVVERFKDHNQ